MQCAADLPGVGVLSTVQPVSDGSKVHRILDDVEIVLMLGWGVGRAEKWSRYTHNHNKGRVTGRTGMPRLLGSTGSQKGLDSGSWLYTTSRTGLRDSINSVAVNTEGERERKREEREGEKEKRGERESRRRRK